MRGPLLVLALMAPALGCASATRFDPTAPRPVVDGALDCEVGVDLEAGQGVAVDLDDAAARHARACAAGHAAACNNLGVMRDEGRGGPDAPAQAEAHFTRACEARPQPDGCLSLAVALVEGGGAPADATRVAA